MININTNTLLISNKCYLILNYHGGRKKNLLKK